MVGLKIALSEVLTGHFFIVEEWIRKLAGY